MKLHANAALSRCGRRRLASRVVDEGWTLTKAAEAAEVSVRTARKWARRYAAEGEAGLADRSSRPKRCPAATPADRVALVCALRRGIRMTGAEIAEVLGMPLTTVQGLLARAGLGRLWRLDLEQVIRYERQAPGELVHIDIKKLGRIQGGAGKRITGRNAYQGSFTDAAGPVHAVTGWEFCHVAIDDFSRLAYAEILPNEKADTAIGFLVRAIAFFTAHGIDVQRVMTDNGSPCVSRAHADACAQLGIRHLRTRPRRPQTNGKAERLIRTLLDGWAYNGVYGSSAERARALDTFITFYNHHRPHGALGHQPPITRVIENNVLRPYS